MMGSPDTEQDRGADEGPQHQVTLAHGFWIGRNELTKAQWKAVMATEPWEDLYWLGDYTRDPNSPAVNIEWSDAQVFINALNLHSGLAFRLPSEAEWEYAYRAGTTTRFPWGDDPDYVLLNDYAWYYSNAWDAQEWYAHPVEQKLCNPWAICDMCGNVREWCQDWYGPYTSAVAIDPHGPTNGSSRVGRGGGWRDQGWACRSAERHAYGYLVDWPMYSQWGFRIAR